MDDAPPPAASGADTDVSEGPASPARLRRFHLDPVGGIAGDMFAAALLDARPDLADGLRAALAGLDLPDSVEIAIDPHRDSALSGARFKVTAPEDDGHGHVRLAEVRARLEAARIAPALRSRALAIFVLLAEAEGAVHGVDPAEVTFHEVGAWDATVDIVAAAYLIEALGPARWSVGPVPLGSGRVRCAHGLLPVPAPAVVHLLRGLVTHDDGIEGERVTPTGAAILKHLAPDPVPAREPETLADVGTGFGSRALPGLSNVLRVLEFAPVAPAAGRNRSRCCAARSTTRHRKTSHWVSIACGRAPASSMFCNGRHTARRAAWWLRSRYLPRWTRSTGRSMRSSTRPPRLACAGPRLPGARLRGIRPPTEMRSARSG